jgi:chromosomal replication initiation ATPase DnaA
MGLMLIPPVGTKAYERWRKAQEQADLTAHQQRGVRREKAIAAQAAIQAILDKASTDADCAAEIERYASIVRSGKWRKRKLRPAKMTAQIAVRRVCALHSIGLRDFMSKNKNRPLILARRDATWLVWRFTGWNLNEIARFFKVDHTTVRHRLVSMERDNPRRLYIARPGAQ